MDKANNEILEKVRKLLALSTSPSEAEAASALAKAQELLARYGLGMADVSTQDPEVTEDVLLEKKRLRKWESSLIHTVSTCTFTQALHLQGPSGGKVVLIGRELNTQAAKELFAYLHITVLKLGRAHSDQVAHLESFRFGLVQRLGERLSELSRGSEQSGGPWAGSSSSSPAEETESRALTVRMVQTSTRENKEYINRKYGKLKTKARGCRVDPGSYHQGRSAGDGVALNRQIT